MKYELTNLSEGEGIECYIVKNENHHYKENHYTTQVAMLFILYKDLFFM